MGAILLCNVGKGPVPTVLSLYLLYTVFCKMLKQYVDDLNSSGVPEVQTTWQQVVQTTYMEVTEKALKAYDDKMVETESKMPMDLKSLLETHDEATALAIKEFKAASQIDRDTDNYHKHLEEMLNNISNTHNPGLGKLQQYIEKNHSRSLEHCRSIIKESKESILDPFLKNLSPDSDIQELLRCVKEIQKELEKKGKGPAKGKVLQEFNEEMKREREKSENTLKLLKSCNAKLQKQEKEKQKQKLLSEKKQNEIMELQERLSQSKEDRQKKITALKDKMQSDEQRYIKDMEEEEKQSKKQFKDMEDSKNELEKLKKSQDQQIKAYKKQLSDEKEKYNRLQAELEEIKRKVEERIQNTDSDSGCSVM